VEFTVFPRIKGVGSSRGNISFGRVFWNLRMGYKIFGTLERGDFGGVYQRRFFWDPGD